MAKSHRTRLPPEKPAKGRLIPKHLAREEFGRRLEELMRGRGWRQAELARRADLQRNAISVYLRGDSFPNPESLEKLASALGVEPDDLLPNYLENTIDRNHPELEMRVSPADPHTAWLRINRAMPTKLAIEILDLLAKHDEKRP